MNTMQTTRGYFSGVEPSLYFGLGDATQIDSIQILWDDKSMTVLKNIKADQTLEVHYLKEKKIPFVAPTTDHVKATSIMLADVRHQENPYDDYRDQVLLPYKMSQNGPYMSVGDLDGDKIQDLFLSGAAGYSGTLLQQNSSGFQKSNQPALITDKNAEDMESAFFDADQDGDQDLLVVSGSNEFQDLDPSLQPRLYINDGKGKLNRSAKNQIPEVKVNGQCIETFDADGDKDMDVFIGGRMIGGKYAVPANSYVWLNDAGHFRDVTQANAPFLEKLGMVTDAIADDVDSDGDNDLIVAGEWMVPTLLKNDGKGKFTQQSIEEAGSGLWWTIEKGDFDLDGDADFLLGNLGWNNKFNGSKQTKLEVYSADFDESGDNDVVLASEKKEGLLPVRGRECTSEEMPFILDKFPTYDAYAKAALNDIYSSDQLNQSAHHKLSTMTSIMLRNDGDGKFASVNLPLMCQSGIVKAFLCR